MRKFLFVTALLILTSILTSLSVFASEEDPARIIQIRKAMELMATPDSLRAPPEDLEVIVKNHEGFRFLAEISEQEILTKPTFEWIQNNLFSGIDKPFVGYFPLKEEGTILGFVIVKKEITGSPVIYLVSPQGELQHLTRHL